MFLFSEQLTEILYEVSINNKNIIQSVDIKKIIENFENKTTVKKEEFIIVVENEKSSLIDFETTFKIYSTKIFAKAKYTNIMSTINEIWKVKLQSGINYFI